MVEWGSTTRIGRGASWRRRCPTAAATPIRGSAATPGRRPRSRRPGAGRPSWNAGGDGPAWSRKRQPFEAPASGNGGPGSGTVPYAELHCHSNFSFLDGASHPEELVTEAARLGLEALALTDHNGFYGIVRFAEAARELGMPTIFGTELTSPRRSGRPRSRNRDSRRPDRRAVCSAARRRRSPRSTPGRSPTPPRPTRRASTCCSSPTGRAGTPRCRRAISLGHLAGEKSAPQFTLDDVAGVIAGHTWALTGCRKGAVPAALVADGPAAAARQLDRLIEAFGRDRVLVELWDHGDPLDSARNDALAELAAGRDVGCVATTNAHYATPAQRRLATALAAVRSRRSLAELDPWLPAAAGAHLRAGWEQQRRFARYPGAVELAAEIGRAAAFDLKLVAPSLPPFPCPPPRANGVNVERDGLPAPHRRGGRAPPLRRAARISRGPLAAGAGVADDRP